MTRRERAQVVELLRCLFDLKYCTCSPDTTPGYEPGIATLAISAIKATRDATPIFLPLRDAMLEAALRVERGEYP